MSGERPPCPIHKPMPCSGDCPNSTDSYVKRERARLMADAWDQGWDARTASARIDGPNDRRANPYREGEKP